MEEDLSKPEPDDCDISPPSQQCLAATLQPGTSLVASGYCLYSCVSQTRPETRPPSRGRL